MTAVRVRDGDGDGDGDGYAGADVDAGGDADVDADDAGGGSDGCSGSVERRVTTADRLQAVRHAITAACERYGRDPESVQLLAVSKTQPAAAVLEARAAGQLAFGENRVQELVAKASEVERVLAGGAAAGGTLAAAAEMTAAPPTWHMIGSLQTNKVNLLLRVARLVLLQSLDREALADALQAALDRRDRRLDALLEVNASGESRKHGVAPAAAAALLRHVVAACPRLRVRGVMAMGPLHGDAAAAFARAAIVRRELEQGSSSPLPVLSLGMTGDMEAAIAAGSTLVRIGTGVFGTRQ